jgi:hypothetical protein
MSNAVNNTMQSNTAPGADPSALLMEMERILIQAQEFFATYQGGTHPLTASTSDADGDSQDETTSGSCCAGQGSTADSAAQTSASSVNPGREKQLEALQGGSVKGGNGIDKTPEANYKGNDGTSAAPLQGSVEDAKAKMYAEVDQELDAVLGKGQYDKPQGHYQYVQRVHQAMKQLSPEQQREMKNRLEIIGQPFHTNFGLTRIRRAATDYAISLNAYNIGPYSGAQAVESNEMKQRFFAERDAALRRN